MVSRRTFLKAAAVAGVAPTIWTQRARAQANSRLALGFIGVGTMGRGHLGSLLGNDAVEVVAVCDVVRERVDSAMKMVRERYQERNIAGSVVGYGDFRKLLEHQGLDAVVIATPDHWHTIPCILAARAGKHIYCEKPLTHNVEEGRHLVNEVSKAGVIFQTGSQQRSEFGGHFRKAVEYIWNGRIGDIKTIRIGVGGPAKPCDLPTEEVPVGTDWDMWLGPAPERGYNEVLCPKGVHRHFPAWRAYQEYAGGGLADMGAHHFDIAQWALQMDDSGPVEIIPPENPASGQGLTFVYANGVRMIHNEFEGDTRADCLFEGTEGSISVSRGGISSRPESILQEPLGDDARRVYSSNNHRQNWLECIQSNQPCICTAEIGHRSATICHLGNIGYRLGRKLKWDPQREVFVDDAGANSELRREPRALWKL